MKLSLSTKPLFSQKLPAIVLFVFEKEQLTGPAAFKKLLTRVGKKEFSGAAQQLLLLHTGGRLAPERILLVGLGSRGSFTPETLRRATGNATKKLQAAGLDRVAIQVREVDHTGTIVEAVILTGYKFTQFKPTEDVPTQIQSLALHLPANADLTAARRLSNQAQIAAEAANFTRSIGDLPGNVVYPAVVADYARQIAKEYKLKCTVLNKRALEAGNFGGLLAVGAGSVREPYLIALEYNGGAKTQRPVALVGKAITFDSGGISIKPSEKMDEMKFDKCGGCAVLGLMRGIAELKLPLNVIGVIASAENMPSAASYRPGDIVTSYRGADKRGVTIEVLNTDAEGRIVLGDALAYARERDPQAIIDFATLTGACVVALGEYAAGLMGNDEQLQDSIRAAGERTGERVWPLPLWQDYKDKIKSHVADIKNTGGRYGGAITAAAFLAKYVGDTPWAHLDIAGTAWATEDRPYYAKGATGFGVRLVLDLLSRWS